MTKYFLLLFTLLMGCAQSDSYNEIDIDGDVRYLRVDAYGIGSVYVMTFDECEYVWTKVGNAGGLTHKGNCKNHSLHRDWMRELSENQNNTIWK